MPRLAGKWCIVYTDNKGGEGCLRKGDAKRPDHDLLAHAVWLLAAKYDVGVWVERVGTDDNLSDLPSRQRYEALEAMGAE
eukprot:5114688-Alexandrium_andersonii.AAC.1